jgi:hypothetical protein
VFAATFKQIKSARHVGSIGFHRVPDRALYRGNRRLVEHEVDACESGRANRRVGQIALKKFKGAFQLSQPLAIAGSEIVDDTNPMILGQKPLNQVGADKSCAACD